MIAEPPVQTNTQPALYTAGQVAGALGISRQAVYCLLDKIPSSGFVLRGGGQVKAWSFSALPGPYQGQLIERSGRLGFRSAEHMLLSWNQEWTPRLPMKEIMPRYVEKAARLKRALEWVLSEIHNQYIKSEDLIAQGIKDYTREVGHAISPQHFRNLLERTLQRDGGAENWNRIEIYLDDNLAGKPKGNGMERIAAGMNTSEIRDTIAQFANPAAPSPDEKAVLWDAIFCVFRDHIDRGMNRNLVVRVLLRHVQAVAPALAKTKDSLRRQFERKYPVWRERGMSPVDIMDKRGAKSGNWRKPELSEGDELKLVARALQCGGRLAQAWRELVREHVLSPELVGYYTANTNSKSYVPRALRDALLPKIDMVMPLHHGVKWARTRGAYVNRDPSVLRPWDWYQGDDTTLPVYFYKESADGFECTRGQFLLMIDLATTFILGCVLVPEKSYRAVHIRNLISSVHDKYGLPNQGFYFERGSWKSRLFIGSQGDEADWTRTESGLKGQLGLRFVYAREARAKMIERVIGSLQNYMERESCYVGRDERHDVFERSQKALAMVRKGKVHPEKVGIYSYDQWVPRLESMCERYNDEPQQGKYLKGLSPHDAFEQHAELGTRMLPDECRYLLATHIIKTRVGRDGIHYRKYIYKSRETGERIGRDVYLFFNPENPKIAAFVDDLNDMKPYVIERATVVPAMDAPGEVLKAALSENAAHDGPSKEYYRTIKNHFAPSFMPRMIRHMATDSITAQLGETMRRKQDAIVREKEDTETLIRQLNRRAASVGMAKTEVDARNTRELEGLRLMVEAQEEHQLQESIKS